MESDSQPLLGADGASHLRCFPGDNGSQSLEDEGELRRGHPHHVEEFRYIVLKEIVYVTLLYASIIYSITLLPPLTDTVMMHHYVCGEESCGIVRVTYHIYYRYVAYFIFWVVSTYIGRKNN